MTSNSPALSCPAPIDPKQVMQRAEAIARDHVVECARELLEWDGTSLLCDGRIRQMARVLSELGVGDQLGIARTVAERAILRHVVAGGA